MNDSRNPLDAGQGSYDEATGQPLSPTPPEFTDPDATAVINTASFAGFQDDLQERRQADAGDDLPGAFLADSTGAAAGTGGPDDPDDFDFADTPVKSRRRAWKWGVSIAAAVLVVVCGSAAAYTIFFADKALPGTNLAGTSLTGMTRDEVADLVATRAAATEVSFTVGDAERTVTLADLGITVDEDATVSEAFSRNSSWWQRLLGLFVDHDKQVQYQVDEDAMADYAGQVATAEGMNASNGAVKLNDEGTEFTVVEASQGQALNSDDLRDLALQAVTTLQAVTGTIGITDVDPTVSTEDAQQVAEQANAIVALDVSVTDQYGSAITASAAEKAAWVTIEVNEDETLQDPALDTEAVTEWVQATAEGTNVAAVNGIQNVNSSGKVVSTPQEGTSGYTVNNVDEVVTAIVTALEDDQSYSGSFEYDVTEPKYEQRLIADGSENLEYQAAPGEKWIDINLSGMTVTAYEGADVVYGPISMVAGASGTETVTGQFTIYLKYSSQTMRGTNLDGSTYVTENVPWVSYFYSGYALHGAYWRSEFGWAGYYSYGGSHGCVNLPVSAAKWIYDWGEIGTVVVSHY